MELKTPDLISTALGEVTSGKRRRYLSVWFGFFLFLYVLNKNKERCMKPQAETLYLYTAPQQ